MNEIDMTAGFKKCTASNTREAPVPVHRDFKALHTETGFSSLLLSCTFSTDVYNPTGIAKRYLETVYDRLNDRLWFE